jgi:hypothetical protein
VRLRGLEIESLVEVHTHAEPSFFDLAVPTQPRAEESDHGGIGVGELHHSIGLRTLAGVERDPGDEEGIVRQGAETLNALLVERSDLRDLRLVGRMRSSVRARAALRRTIC